MNRLMNPVTRAASTVSLGGFVFGFDAAVIGGIVGAVATQFDLAPWEIGMLVSAPTLSAVAASFTVGLISDIIGRKKILILLAALFVVSAVFSAFAWSFMALVVARAIGGYAFGCLTQAPVYIAEISPAEKRGRLVAINQLAIVIGLSAAFFSNFAIQTFGGDLPLFDEERWRLMLAVELVPALLWLFGMFTVPETPRWLATQSRWDEVKAVLTRLGSSSDPDTTIAEIKADVGQEKAQVTANLASLFGRSVWFAFIIGIIIAIVQQVTGINTVLFYAATIFEQTGVGTNAAFTQAVFVGVTFVVFTIVAMVLIDRIGRRPLMIAGLIGVTTSLAIVAFGFNSATYALDETGVAKIEAALEDADLSSIQDVEYPSDIAFKSAVSQLIGSDTLRDNEGLFLAEGMRGNSTLILIAILGFVASFAFSLGPVMWVYLAEIFPNRVRGVAISFVTIFNSGASWLVQFLFPIQLASGGIAGVFTWYASFGLIGLILVAWLMPETKGLSLEQVSDKMASKFRKAPATP